MKVYVFTILLFLFSIFGLFAQQPDESVVTKTDIKFYGNLYHQHHDFFGEAFSFQGIEGGVIIHKNLFLGLYGSFFATNLNAELNNKSQYVWIGQYGISASYIILGERRIHPGGQLNAGFFTLRYDDHNFGLFDVNKMSFKVNGLIFSPQIFGEVIVTDWFRIRTGLSYNLYNFNDQSIIKTSDLNHISFTFGMVFNSGG